MDRADRAINVELPTDRNRDPQQRPHLVILECPNLLSARTQAERIAQHRDCFVEQVWIAAFAIVLRRYGNELVNIGCEIQAGQQHILPIHVRNDDRIDDIFEAIAESERVFELDEFENSFDDNTDALGRALHAGFVPRNAANLHGWARRADLVLVSTAGEGMPCIAHNDLVLTSEATSNIALHLATVVAQVAEYPDRAVAEFELLPKADQSKIRAARGSATTDLEQFGLIEEQIAGHGVKAPDALAVSDAATQITYAQLNSRANRLARYLLSLSSDQPRRVGVCLDRSVDCVVAHLAVWRAGASVVIMDPNQPIVWLTSIADTAASDVLICAQRHCEDFEAFKLVCLDECWGEIEQFDDSKPSLEKRATFDDPDAIAATSGSTGKPKLVIGKHRALNNMIEWGKTALSIRSDSRASWVGSPGYGLCRAECWIYLASGAHVCIADPSDISSPMRLLDWLVAQSVTHTTQMTMMAERLWRLPSANWGALRVMQIAGERLHAWPPTDLPFEVYNNYGSTEATIIASCPLVAKARELSEGQRILMQPVVGPTIANVRAYVVDENMCEVPTGIRGELFVAGDGLSNGYSDPVITQEKFLRDCMHDVDEPVIYRTGDAAKYHFDGSLEVLGRIDDEVKILGSRANVSDTARLCEGLDGVKEAVVTSEATVDGTTRLIAYVVPQQNIRLKPELLQKEARIDVPAHMVPSRFHVVDELPVLSNGKIDRQSLPALARDPVDHLVKPRGPIEEKIAEKWEKVLKVKVESAHDNFFDHGGHSLLALDLVAELRADLGVEISIPVLNKAPTVAGLSRIVQQYLLSGSAAQLPKTERVLGPVKADIANRFAPFPLTEMQQALWVGRTTGVEMGGLGCVGYFEWDCPDVSPDKLELAWQTLIDRHEMLRTVFRSDGSQCTLTDLPKYKIENYDLRDLDMETTEARIDTLRDEMSQLVLPADQWPLFRIGACQLNDGRTRLMMSIDLLILDAWSYFHILVPELAKILDKESGDLPPLECTFRDYLSLLTDELESTSAFERARTYWLNRLDSLPEGPALPMRLGNSPNRPIRFETMAKRLPHGRWSQLKGAIFGRSMTPTAVLIAAFAELLRAYGAENRFTLNLPIFAREPAHRDVVGIVGDFTTTLLLAVEKYDGTFFERAASLQEQLWEDLEHRQFNGIRVIREQIRTGKRRVGAAMPVVVTSLLDQPSRNDLPSLGREVLVLSQTPQVLLDLQLRETDGDLLVSWAYLDGLLSTETITAMFQDYFRIIEELVDDPEAWELNALEIENVAQASGSVTTKLVQADSPNGPTTENDPNVENLLAGLASAMFDIEIERDDDLMRAGVDSLGIIRWVVQIGEIFALELPLKRVFENATVSHVCSIIAERPDWQKRATATTRVLIQQVAESSVPK